MVVIYLQKERNKIKREEGGGERELPAFFFLEIRTTRRRCCIFVVWYLGMLVLEGGWMDFPPRLAKKKMGGSGNMLRPLSLSLSLSLSPSAHLAIPKHELQQTGITVCTDLGGDNGSKTT
jgi:hypothetical protein